MTNVAEMQDVIVISAPVPRDFDRRLRIAVAERGIRSKAEAIRQAVQQWMDAEPCPQCDGRTVADPRQPGVRYCLDCGEAVSYKAPGVSVS